MEVSEWRVYKVENLKNGMIFIGKTDKPIEQSVKWEITKPCLMGLHVSKMGMDSFSVSTLEDNLTELEAIAKRVLYIKQYNSVKPRGYNDSLFCKRGR